MCERGEGSTETTLTHYLTIFARMHSVEGEHFGGGHHRSTLQGTRRRLGRLCGRRFTERHLALLLIDRQVVDTLLAFGLIV